MCYNLLEYQAFNLLINKRRFRILCRRKGLLNTKIYRSNVDQIMNNCIPGWRMENNHEFHDRGKIWVCWDTFGVVHTVGKGLQYITLEIQLIIGSTFLVIAVYASTDMAVGRDLWDYLV